MNGNELTTILDNIIANLEANDVNLQETPALFKWRHPINHQYEFQLLIKIIDAEDDEGESHSVH